jgi:hypothetical protein
MVRKAGAISSTAAALDLRFPRESQAAAAPPHGRFCSILAFAIGIARLLAIRMTRNIVRFHFGVFTPANA